MNRTVARYMDLALNLKQTKESYMKEVLSNDAPQPAGHYSQAIEHHGLVYVSGQLPINPKSKKKYILEVFWNW